MRIVSQNTVCFLERFGAFKKSLSPGLNLYIPVIETVSRPISLMEQISPIAHQKVITKDNVEIDVNGYFFYKVTDPMKAHYSIENFEDAISGLSTSVSRSEIGKSSLDEIFQFREKLNDRIKIILNESAKEWGIECLNYEIIKIEPPLTIRQSLLEVASAERIRRKEVILSEAEREFQERVSSAKRDAEILVQSAKWEGLCICNEEYKKALEELESVLLACQDKERVINYILVEEYITKMKTILKSKNVHIIPETRGGESSDSFVVLSAVLSQMNATKGTNFTIEEIVDKIKTASTLENKKKKQKEIESKREEPKVAQNAENKTFGNFLEAIDKGQNQGSSSKF